MKQAPSSFQTLTFPWQILPSISICCTAIPQYHRWDGFNDGKYLLIIWRPEVWDQGVGRFGFSRDFSPCLTEVHLSVSSSVCLSLYHVVCVRISSSYKDAHHIGLGCTRKTPFEFNYSLKTPFLTIVIFWSTGIRSLTSEFWWWGYNSINNSLQQDSPVYYLW